MKITTGFWDMTSCSLVNVRFEVLTLMVMKSSVLWDISPCRPLKINRSFGGTFRLHLQCRRISQAKLATCLMLVCCLSYPSIQKMEAACSFETSLDIQRTTRHYIPEVRNLQRGKCLATFRRSMLSLFSGIRVNRKGESGTDRPIE
jgi:hypothetical protein